MHLKIHEGRDFVHLQQAKAATRFSHSRQTAFLRRIIMLKRTLAALIVALTAFCGGTAQAEPLKLTFYRI